MNDGYLTIALPKGRIGKTAMEYMEKLGIFDVVKQSSRKLIFIDETIKIRYMFVKAVDVVTYVNSGVADLGVVGRDIILEENAAVYELLDLGFGRCKFSVAGFKGTDLHPKNAPLRVATKYPNVARRYFKRRNQPIDIIKLNGSVELGPIAGLSDVIVDIVETGGTLRANGLEVLEDMMEISAKLIANPAAYRFKRSAIRGITDMLNERVEKNA